LKTREQAVVAKKEMNKGPFKNHIRHHSTTETDHSLTAFLAATRNNSSNQLLSVIHFSPPDVRPTILGLSHMFLALLTMDTYAAPASSHWIVSASFMS
jgi:hypothetical protein